MLDGQSRVHWNMTGTRTHHRCALHYTPYESFRFSPIRLQQTVVHRPPGTPRGIHEYQLQLAGNHYCGVRGDVFQNIELHYLRYLDPVIALGYPNRIDTKSLSTCQIFTTAV